MYHSGPLPLTSESPEQAFEGGGGGGGGLKTAKMGVREKPYLQTKIRLLLMRVRTFCSLPAEINISSIIRQSFFPSKTIPIPKI